MYLNQNFKKSAVIVTLILGVVFSMGEAKNYNQGPDVNDIYVGIRYSAPVYEWEESIVTFENEGMTLVCSLTIPDTGQKAPIIITLNGFTGDRNDLIIPGTDEPFYKRAARILAEQGFASLRVDFRGSGESDGEYSMTTFSTQISDTIAALDYITSTLKHQVNSKSIGIIGFSQGGLVGSVTAARDSRVDSIALWSAPAFPIHDYEGLLTKPGIKSGLALEQGSEITLGVYLDGIYLGFDVTLGKGFFEDLFQIDPLAELRNYRKPLMYVAGTQDPIVWPQPKIGKTFLTYHDGYEKLVEINGGHNFDFAVEKVDDVFYWSTAWFIKTLKHKEK